MLVFRSALGIRQSSDKDLALLLDDYLRVLPEHPLMPVFSTPRNPGPAESN